MQQLYLMNLMWLVAMHCFLSETKSKCSHVWPTGIRHYCIRTSTRATKVPFWPLANTVLFHMCSKYKTFALKCSVAFKNKKSHRRNLWFLFNKFAAHKISTIPYSVVEEDPQTRLITNAVTYGLVPI